MDAPATHSQVSAPHAVTSDHRPIGGGWKIWATLCVVAILLVAGWYTYEIRQARLAEEARHAATLAALAQAAAQSAQAAKTAPTLDQIQSAQQAAFAAAIRRGTVLAGMTRDDAYAARGEPAITFRGATLEPIHRQMGAVEVWAWPGAGPGKHHSAAFDHRGAVFYSTDDPYNSRERVDGPAVGER